MTLLRAFNHDLFTLETLLQHSLGLDFSSTGLDGAEFPANQVSTCYTCRGLLQDLLRDSPGEARYPKGCQTTATSFWQKRPFEFSRVHC